MKNNSIKRRNDTRLILPIGLGLIALSLQGCDLGCIPFGCQIRCHVDVEAVDKDNPDEAISFTIKTFDSAGNEIHILNGSRQHPHRPNVVAAYAPRSETGKDCSLVKGAHFVEVSAVGYKNVRVPLPEGSWKYETVGRTNTHNKIFSKQVRIELDHTVLSEAELPTLFAAIDSGKSTAQLGAMRTLKRSNMRPKEAVPALLRALASSKTYDYDEPDIQRRELAKDLLLEIMGEEWLIPQIIECMKKASDLTARKSYLIMMLSLKRFPDSPLIQEFVIQLSNNPREPPDIRGLARSMIGPNPSIMKLSQVQKK